jgi:hypothetical protein
MHILRQSVEFFFAFEHSLFLFVSVCVQLLQLLAIYPMLEFRYASFNLCFNHI